MRQVAGLFRLTNQPRQDADQLALITPNQDGKRLMVAVPGVLDQPCVIEVRLVAGAVQTRHPEIPLSTGWTGLVPRDQGGHVGFDVERRAGLDRLPHRVTSSRSL